MALAAPLAVSREPAIHRRGDATFRENEFETDFTSQYQQTTGSKTLLKDQINKLTSYR